MNVRLRRASKAATFTLLIIISTVLVSIWLSNPPPPISWEIYGHVSYIDTIFNIEIPESSNISYDVDIDDTQNTTRIYVEINTELNMNRGLLNYRTESTYITPQSWYNIEDYQEASLSSRFSSETRESTYGLSLPFRGLNILGVNESFEQHSVLPTEYSLQMIWNSSLTLVEERDNDTSFELYLDFRIHFNETQVQADPAIFGLLYTGECIIGTAVIVGFYIIDRPQVID